MDESSSQPASQTTPPDGIGRRRWRGTQVAFGAVIACILVLVAYVWIISLGTWTDWTYAYTFSHYDKLADAFIHGQLSLRLPPDPSLLALPDPYDPSQRKDVPFLIDASLYGGRYYLYFGPVPAFLLLVPKLLTSAVVHDVYLLFGFVCALFVVETMFVMSLRRRFFEDVPWWLVSACILLIGLSAPFTWLLDSPATPHNAAIAAGQACFIGGLWTAFSAVAERRVRADRAFAAGTLFACAIGCRLTQLIPIATFSSLMALFLARRRDRQVPVTRAAVSFLAPLITGVIALCWYNWARFGVVTETGISYQLASLPIQQHMREVFSAGYVPQNLYNYLVNPPRLRLVFPYIWPQLGSRTPILPGINLSSIYFTEQTTGLLYFSPTVLFTLAALFPKLTSREDTLWPDADRRWLRWLRWGLGLSSLAGLAVLLAFFWSDNRYLADFYSPLLLLGVLDLWQVSESLKKRPEARARTIAVGLALICASLVVSVALAIGQNAGAFAAFDPKIGRFIRRILGQ